MKRPLVSVIIPAYNEAKVIGRLLASLKSQSYPNIEIIVIDDNSTDATPKIAKTFTSHVFTRPHAERSVQRNYGAAKSTGDYLLVLDADMELSPPVIQDCLDAVTRHPNIGAVVIPETSIATNFWERCKAFERSFYAYTGDTGIEAARFFPKKVFNQVGGYDQTITGTEDWDLPETIQKQGFKHFRINSTLNHYERIPSLIKLIKKKYYYALSSHRYLSKHGLGIFTPKTIYFLRPNFYKHWTHLFSSPVLSLGLIFMLSCELVGGGVGFLVGKVKHG